MDTPKFNSEHSVYRSRFFHFVIFFLCSFLMIQQLQADTSGYISDDFNTSSLNTSLWTFVDPLGDGSLVVNGTQLMLSVPSGVSHDIWSSGNDSVRVMQTIADVDFQLEIKFESDITEQYQIQGVVIEQDNSNFIRFDFYSDGTNTKIFAATVAGGSASSKVNTTISSYSPLTMRVTRSINDWTVEYSLDGNIWITAGKFSHTLTVTAAGPFVANDGSTSIPSHTAIIDYIFNTASIIDPEDGVLDNDTESPFIRDIRKVAGNDHFEVLWQTDEVATGSIDYGVTTAYELGTIEHTTFDLEHHLIVPGLNTGTTYQFQLRSNDLSGNENVSNNFQLNVSDNPFIDSWYGSLLNFGQLGSNSAHWINILGNVSGENALDSFRYALNGGSTVSLKTGPDGKRLQYDGDFNADIEYLEFNDGANTLDIIAQDILGNQTTESITINYAENNNWPMPYSIDWQTVSNIEDVAQIVDGQWLLTSEGIRTAQLGYDRLLSIGDINWDNYEVTVPVTVHGMDAVCTSDLQNDPCNGGAAVGVLVRWQGHHSSTSQPNSNWIPLGALGWYRWKYSISTQTHSPGLYLTGGDGSTILSDESASLPSGVKHILKIRAETISGQHEYKLKMWEESDPEPNSWDLQGTQTLAESFGNGSILLLTHYMDVTFGNVEVTSLNGADTTPPVISNLQSTTTATSATITWTTNEASDSLVNYGLDSSYGSNNANATLVTSHSLTLNGLVSDTQYHYQASSTDGSSNTATSVDLTFTTSSPGEGSPSGLISDDFNAGSLDSAWTIYDPVGDSTFSFTGTELSIAVPAGTSHDLWTDGRLSPRVSQQTNNTDFELEVKFNSAVTQQYQMQGIIVEQDDDNLLRFDFYYDGTQTRIYSASFVGGVATKRIKKTIPDGVPLYLRVNRTGDLWIEYYSYDGTIWTEAGRYTHALTVTSTSVFGGNAGNSAPAHNVLVDYFTVDGLPPDTGADTTPPVISNVQVTVTNTTATITWDTDELSDSTVNYGLDSSYGQTEGGVTLVTSHSITLSGLTAGTVYNYQVTSGDSAGNVASSSNLTFTTTDISGLLAYWPMDEGTGTSIIDMTGNGNTGTLTNGPLWVAGAGLDFDGIDDYVDLGAMDVSGSELSISAWVYADNIANCSSKDCRIISKATGTGTQDHYFMVSTIQSNGVNRLRFRLKTDGTTSTLISSSGVITENEWFHVVAVYDGSTMKLFLNGLEIGSKSKTGTLSTNNNVSTWLGGNPPSATGRPWDGQIDNLRIYDQALSTVEINDLYNDLSVPVISNIQIISTDIDATVTWDTSKPADSNLEYGLDAGYGTVINETSLVTSHSITMTNLTANTTYYYQFSSTDSSSNTASSGGLSFTTTSGPDVTPPLISNVQVAATNTTATITWDTDEVSDSTVNYGLNSSYGSNSSDATFVTSHSLILNGLTSDTEYHYQASSTDGSSNTALSSDLTFTTSTSGAGSPSGLISDDFNSGNLDSAWSIYDPIGDSTFSFTGTELSISVPAGTSHDLWTSGRLAPRVRQLANNTDFELEVKFNSTVNLRYQIQGMTVEQDDDNLLRFDFHYDGTRTRIYSASFVGGVATKRIRKTIPDGAPLYLRVNRTGDLWIEYYSYDGTIWTEAGRYTHALTVTSTSVFGGNAGNSAPAHNVLVDYFTVDGLPPNGAP